MVNKRVFSALPLSYGALLGHGAGGIRTHNHWLLKHVLPFGSRSWIAVSNEVSARVLAIGRPYQRTCADRRLARLSRAVHSPANRLRYLRAVMDSRAAVGIVLCIEKNAQRSNRRENAPCGTP